jgi:hypothetical protein
MLAVELLTNHVKPPPPPNGPTGHHRPLGVVLSSGSAVTRAWLSTKQTYDLSHDGVGWVVSSPLWTDGNHYRLFNGATYVSSLVGTEIGSDTIALIPLDPQARYQLLFDDPVLMLIRNSSAPLLPGSAAEVQFSSGPGGGSGAGN